MTTVAKAVNGLHDVAIAVCEKKGIEEARTFLKKLDYALALIKKQKNEIERLKSQQPKIGVNMQLAYEEGFHDGYNQAMSEMPEIIYCADCPEEDREECEKQYGRVQNEWNCRFGRRKGQ